MSVDRWGLILNDQVMSSHTIKNLPELFTHLNVFFVVLCNRSVHNFEVCVCVWGRYVVVSANVTAPLVTTQNCLLMASKKNCLSTWQTASSMEDNLCHIWENVNTRTWISDSLTRRLHANSFYVMTVKIHSVFHWWSLLSSIGCQQTKLDLKQRMSGSWCPSLSLSLSHAVLGRTLAPCWGF